MGEPAKKTIILYVWKEPDEGWWRWRGANSLVTANDSLQGTAASEAQAWASALGYATRTVDMDVGPDA